MDATNGKVKVTYFHAESLGKAPDFLTLLNGGVTDVVNVTPGDMMMVLLIPLPRLLKMLD